MNAIKRSDTPDNHAPTTDAEAYDLLADWIRRGPAGERDVERCYVHPDGTWELVLRHEECDTADGLRAHSRSVTQRTLSSAIRSALGIARWNGAV